MNSLFVSIETFYFDHHNMLFVDVRSICIWSERSLFLCYTK